MSNPLKHNGSVALVPISSRPDEIGPLSGSESRFQTFDWLPQREDSRTSLMSEECFNMAGMVANLAS